MESGLGYLTISYSSIWSYEKLLCVLIFYPCFNITLLIVWTTHMYYFYSSIDHNSDKGLTRVKWRCGSGENWFLFLFWLLEGTHISWLMAPSSVLKANQVFSLIVCPSHFLVSFSFPFYFYVPLRLIGYTLIIQDNLTIYG